MCNTHFWLFNPNVTVTTLRSGLCYRKSICRLSVCNVRAPYTQGLKLWQCLCCLGGVINYDDFFAILYLSHPLTSVQNFMEMSQGNFSVRSVKRKEYQNRETSRSSTTHRVSKNYAKKVYCR